MRRQIYRALFKEKLSDAQWQEIHDATNKAWVLGNNKFKQQIENLTGRRASPLPRGGDRKSQKYKEDLNKSENQLL